MGKGWDWVAWVFNGLTRIAMLLEKGNLSHPIQIPIIAQTPFTSSDAKKPFLSKVFSVIPLA